MTEQRERITFRLPAKIKRQFQAKLALEGRKAQDVLEEYVRDYLAREEEEDGDKKEQ